MTTVQLIAVALALGVVGMAIGWLIEEGIGRLTGPAYWVAGGLLFATLAATAVWWLSEDLARAGVPVSISLPAAVGLFAIGAAVIAYNVVRSRF